jgi:hypothetical protein
MLIHGCPPIVVCIGAKLLELLLVVEKGFAGGVVRPVPPYMGADDRPNAEICASPCVLNIDVTMNSDAAMMTAILLATEAKEIASDGRSQIILRLLESKDRLPTIADWPVILIFFDFLSTHFSVRANRHLTSRRRAEGRAGTIGLANIVANKKRLSVFEFLPERSRILWC